MENGEYTPDFPRVSTETPGIAWKSGGLSRTVTRVGAKLNGAKFDTKNCDFILKLSVFVLTNDDFIAVKRSRATRWSGSDSPPEVAICI